MTTPCSERLTLARSPRPKCLYSAAYISTGSGSGVSTCLPSTAGAGQGWRTTVPARSRKQQRFLFARFGKAWAKRHHFDKLRRKRKKGKA